MKTQLTKLRRLIRNGYINPDDFYCITVRDAEILLQGHFNSEIVKRYSATFEMNTDKNGYVVGRRSNIDITLT